MSSSTSSSSSSATNGNRHASPPSSLPWYLKPSILATATGTAVVVLSGRHVWAKYLRRISNARAVPEAFWRRRSVLGRVTSVGDGDGLRLFHTPGGRFAGWGWLPWRRVPRRAKDLKDRTISVRLAGVDAPEMAHFGRPAQPGAVEAFDFLTSFVTGCRVRAYLHKRDQYERAVATVYVRRGLLFRRKDVSLELLRQGLATVYDAKVGVEFGGPGKEKAYRAAEEKAKRWRKGIWGHLGKEPGKERESPMAFKKRMAKSQDDTSSK